MPRRLKEGILKEFCLYCSDTEIPSRFALWAGIMMIASALSRDGFIDMGHFTVYPNMYVVLVAGSAKCRKSTVIRVAEKFITSIRPSVNLLSQKMTPEALIQSLTSVDGDEGGTEILSTSEGVIIVDELATLIDKNAFANGMIPLLTKLWDSEGEFEYKTRARGSEKITNSCLSLFGGSTLSWIKEAVPIVAIGGGFTSRVVFVYQDNPEKLIARPRMSQENREREEKIVHDLNEIAKIRGEFGMTEEAWILFDKEYVSFSETSEFYNNPNLEGYAGRRGTMLLKLAMIISASERDTRQINIQDVQVALRVLQQVEQFMPKVMAVITSEDIGDITEEICQYLKKKKVVLRHEVIKRFRRRLAVNELDIVLDTLVQARMIQQKVEGKDITYIYM